MNTIEHSRHKLLYLYYCLVTGRTAWAANPQDFRRLTGETGECIRVAHKGVAAPAGYAKRESQLAFDPIERRPTKRALRPKGFTLLELLVCVAIIALLAALILPCLAGAKAKAKRVHCASNLRQQAMALALYVNDHGCYPTYGPPDSYNPDPSVATNRSLFWDYALMGYSGKGVFACPAHALNIESNWITLWQDNAYPNKSYGYNALGTIGGCGLSAQWYAMDRPRYVRDSQVISPANMLAIADYDINAIADGTDRPFPYLLYTITLSAKWHATGAQGVFCDAHAEFARLKDWRAAKEKWNADNQRH